MPVIASVSEAIFVNEIASSLALLAMTRDFLSDLNMLIAKTRAGFTIAGGLHLR